MSTALYVGLAVSGAVALTILAAGWALAAYAKHLDTEMDRADVDPHAEPADSGLASEVEGFLRDVAEPQGPPVVPGREQADDAELAALLDRHLAARQAAEREEYRRESAYYRTPPAPLPAGEAGGPVLLGDPRPGRPEGLCRYVGEPHNP